MINKPQITLFYEEIEKYHFLREKKGKSYHIYGNLLKDFISSSQNKKVISKSISYISYKNNSPYKPFNNTQSFIIDEDN